MKSTTSSNQNKHQLSLFGSSSSISDYLLADRFSTVLGTAGAGAKGRRHLEELAKPEKKQQEEEEECTLL